MKKILFFGASKFGYEVCKYILQNNIADIVGIITIPERFEISYSESKVRNVQFADMRELAEHYNIPVRVINGKLSDEKEYIKEFHAQLFLVIGWYHLISKSIRDLAPLGCVGIHASLLPKYRGGAPLVWAIINGEKETGVTLFYFDTEIDAGDIIGQSKIVIEPFDTIRSVLSKAKTAAIELTAEYIPRIFDGTAPKIKQIHDEATIYPQRTPKDGEINWDWEPERIRNFIRAQTKPYPGAFTIIGDKKVTIWDAEIKIQ